MPLNPKTHHNTHVHVRIDLYKKALFLVKQEGSFTSVLNNALEAYLRLVILPAKTKKRMVVK